MTKHDVQITIDNKIVEIEQTYQNNIAHMKALHERKEQTYQNKITEMEQVHQSKIAEIDKQDDRREQTHQSQIAEMDKIKQIHQSKIAEIQLLKDKIKMCKENCDRKNLELKILEKQTISDRFKMNFNVDKKKVEFKFEEIK